eukprot:1187619-Prorocentrum_minimum.AAC.5
MGPRFTRPAPELDLTTDEAGDAKRAPIVSLPVARQINSGRSTTHPNRSQGKGIYPPPAPIAFKEKEYQGGKELDRSGTRSGTLCRARLARRVQSSPVQSSPVQSNPVQSSPVQSSPIQSSPVQSS